MDADRFDALTRTLTGEARSRRSVLQGLASSAVAALAAALGFTDAEATHYGCRHRPGVGLRHRDRKLLRVWRHYLRRSSIVCSCFVPVAEGRN